MFDKTINISKLGAVGNNLKDNTDIIQKAIDNNTAEGAVIYFPKGIYKTGTLFLKSNITLYLDNDAILSGIEDITYYKKNYKGCIEAPSFDTCLIYAENAANISLLGNGTIDGNGKSFKGERPMLIRFISCENIKIRDITFKNSGSWCCHMISCKDVYAESMKIDNNVNVNNDGFDLDSCQNVFISNVYITSNDDCICLKSTTRQPCENIVITNCILESTTATVKLGTSSLSGFRNVSISNCIFKNCPMGTIKLIMVDGGRLENINISNIVMDNVGSPLFIRIGKRNLKYETPAEMDFWGEGEKNNDLPGNIQNIMISDIQANVTVTEKNRTPIMITGLKESPVKNVTLKNINVSFPGGGTEEDSKIIVPEDEYKYPEQWFFGVLPAWGMFLRHIDGIVLDQIKFTLKSQDKRQLLVQEDVKDIDIYNSKL